MNKQKTIEQQELEFCNIARKIDMSQLSSFEDNFITLYIRASSDRRIKLFNALPEIIEKITREWNYQLKKKQERKEDNKYLRFLLKEYLSIFKHNKQHQKIHKNKPCLKCELAKKMLRELRSEYEIST